MEGRARAPRLRRPRGLFKYEGDGTKHSFRQVSLDVVCPVDRIREETEVGRTGQGGRC